MTTAATARPVDNTAALAYLSDLQDTLNYRLESMRSAITTGGRPNVNKMLEAMSGFMQHSSLFEEQFFLLVDDGTEDFADEEDELE